MWHMVILTSMTAVAGYYALMDTPARTADSLPQQAELNRLADSMAVFRKAALDYVQASANANGLPTGDLSLQPQDLQQGGFLPNVSASAVTAMPWRSHYSRNDGMVYIYSERPLPGNLYNQLMERTYHSALIGIVRTSQNVLDTPQNESNDLSVPPQVRQRAAADTPVWVSTLQSLVPGRGRQMLYAQRNEHEQQGGGSLPPGLQDGIGRGNDGRDLPPGQGLGVGVNVGDVGVGARGNIGRGGGDA